MISSISKEDRAMMSKLMFEMGVKTELLRLHLYHKYPEVECNKAVSKELNDLDIMLSNAAGNLDLLAAKHSPIGELPKNVQRTARERFARENKRTNAIASVGR